MHYKKTILPFLIIFIFTTTFAMGQVKNYTGAIVDIFDNPMFGVEVTNERTQEMIVSSCKGKFSIRANQGDQLTFFKDNYLFHQQQIKSGKKMAVLLNFDTEIIKSKIYKDYVTLHDYEAPLDDVFCQILFIVNGNPFNSNNGTSRFLDLRPEAIFSVRVLKGQLAKEMFGNAGRNGVVLIHTKCSSEGRINFPAAYEE